MVEKSTTEKSKWHRVGIGMSMIALVVTIVAAVLLSMPLTQLASLIPSNLHIVTTHSDTPSQVEGAVVGLEEEALFRVTELQKAAVRARIKANDCRLGLDEDSHLVKTEAERAKLSALAPQWDQVAARADQAVATIKN